MVLKRQVDIHAVNARDVEEEEGDSSPDGEDLHYFVRAVRVQRKDRYRASLSAARGREGGRRLKRNHSAGSRRFTASRLAVPTRR